MSVSEAPGASLEFTFSGTAIRWVARKFDDAGSADVFIDGRPAGRIDLYSARRGEPFQWDARDLPSGRHLVRIVNRPDHHADSRGRYINFLRFEALLADQSAAGHE